MKFAISALVLSATLLLVIGPTSTNAFCSPTDDVVELTASNFDRLVINDDAIWVVEFFALWCGHSQSLVPEYKKLAKALKGVVKVGSVNADEHQSLCAQYDVSGFPTIIIFGANKLSPSEFDGHRTAKAIAESALAEVKKKVQAALEGDVGNSRDQLRLCKRRQS